MRTKECGSVFGEKMRGEDEWPRHSAKHIVVDGLMASGTQRNKNKDLQNCPLWPRIKGDFIRSQVLELRLSRQDNNRIKSYFKQIESHTYTLRFLEHRVSHNGEYS